MPAKQIPVAIGLMLCDQVIIAEKSRDITPVNCFATRKVAAFPSSPFPFTALALLANGLGEILLEVAIQRLDTGEDVYRRATGRFENPLADMFFKATIRDCSFPVAGYYELTLFGDGEVLASRRFALRAKENSHE